MILPAGDFFWGGEWFVVYNCDPSLLLYVSPDQQHHVVLPPVPRAIQAPCVSHIIHWFDI